jgi:transcriptional regulator with XRE-family HTH domain
MTKKKHSYSQQTLHALTLFGEHIRYARKIRHMTASELAERLGVSRSTVQEIEKGKEQVAIGTYFEASTLLGIELFQHEHLSISAQRDYLQNKVALLPKRTHQIKIEVKDDF